MKNKLLLEALYTIKNTIGKYITLLFIVLFGVGFFAGMLSISTIMEESVENYYDNQDFFDYQLYSNVGFLENEIEELQKFDENIIVQPSKFLDVEASYNDISSVIRMESYNESHTINNFVLVDGRLPTNKGEALAEASGEITSTPKIGDVVTITRTNQPVDQVLETDEYVIVGTVSTPNHMSKVMQTSTLENLQLSSYLYVNENNFVGDVYTTIYMKDRSLTTVNSFTQEYTDKIDNQKDNLESFIETLETDKEELLKHYTGQDSEVEWTVLTRGEHYSAASYVDTVSQMEVIGLLFPIFFFLVAALVCLTTMSRMVSEQRGQIGTLRALGYSKMACLSKYLLYSISATLIGGILGSFLGVIVFPQIIYSTWNLTYNLPEIAFTMPWMTMVLSIAIFIVVMLLTTIFAIGKETSELPSQLMRPKSPPAGKKILLEKISPIWKRMSFTSKVTARNILRYKKRLLMTVLGIGGCTCLLITGFGMRDSIGSIVSIQFDELTHYDGAISINSDANIGSIDDALKELDSDIVTTSLNSYASLVTKDDKEVAYMQVYNNASDLHTMNLVRDNYSKEVLELHNDYVFINVKLAELLNVQVGDTITIESDTGKQANVAVGGIFEKYINHEVYITSSYYKEIFNEESTPNTVQFISDLDEADNLQKILDIQGVEAVMFNSSFTSTFDSIISGMDLVVVVIIVSAAALAFVVLGNLATINISERKREIATLKVLGFNYKETKDYIFKESIVSTLLGSLVGIVLGLFAHNFIINQVEMDFMMFGRVASLLSIFYSVVITFIFSIMVNKFMLSRVKNIDMIESLKSVE